MEKRPKISSVHSLVISTIYGKMSLVNVLKITTGLKISLYFQCVYMYPPSALLLWEE